MDCKTARLLLDFVRPQASEMDAAETAALEQHLAGCPECDASVRAERGLDHAFAKAMNAVEVPTGLRNRLLVRLDRERGDVYLRWFGHAARASAAAAAIFLLVWGIIVWNQTHLPAVDMDRVWEEIHASRVAPPSGEALAEEFHRLGFKGPFPDGLNYTLLTGYGLGEFEGQQVPQLFFFSQQGDAQAEVIVLSSRQFDLNKLQTSFQSPEGYPYKVEAWRDPTGCAEIVTYSGDNANWLRLEPTRD